MSRASSSTSFLKKKRHLATSQNTLEVAEVRPMKGPPPCCPPNKRCPISGDMPKVITICLATYTNHLANILEDVEFMDFLPGKVVRFARNVLNQQFQKKIRSGQK